MNELMNDYTNKIVFCTITESDRFFFFSTLGLTFLEITKAPQHTAYFASAALVIVHESFIIDKPRGPSQSAGNAVERNVLSE